MIAVPERLRTFRPKLLFALVVTFLLLVAACSPAPKATPTPRPTPVPTPTPAGVSGADLYNRLGCVGCHGPQGWGSQLAPPLAGAPVDEIKATVRNPKPPMPRFGPEQLSDADLDVLARYENSLKPPTLTSDLKIHLEAALKAAEAKDKSGAELHLKEAIKVAPSELKGSLEFILEEAEEGEFEEVEEFLGRLMGIAQD